MTAPKITERLPFDKYIRLPGVHSTALKDMLVSPRAYRSRMTREPQDRDTLRVGRAGHTFTLEPDRAMLDYAVFTAKDDDGNLRIRRGKVWDAFCEANADKTILTVPQYETAVEVRDAVRSHPVAGALLAEKGKAELTIEWTHERTGIRCVSRFDWLCGSALVDLKLTRDPSPGSFSRDAAKYGYPFQLAMYSEALRVADLGPRPVKIIAAQNVDPFDVVVFDIGEELLGHGREQFEMAMTKLAACNESRLWPGIAPNEELSLALPAWASPSLADEPLTINGETIF
jgi:hypothetical protein